MRLSPLATIPAFLVLALATASPLAATPEKRCVTEQPIEVLLSANITGPRAVQTLNDQLTEGLRIEVSEKNDSVATQFVRKKLAPRDCVLFNRMEAADYVIGRGAAKNVFQTIARGIGLGGKTRARLVPIVLFRDRDGSRHFGLAEESALIGLHAEPHRELTAAQLLAHGRPGTGITILYVLCPADRQTPCTLSIRSNGKWLTSASGKRLTFEVLARSRRREGDPATSFRLRPGGDTPQGIYYVWGTLFTRDPAFGNQPRIDLDAAIPPINALPYELHSFVLEEILPRSAWDDYWALEWALAYKLGRIHLRIHANPSTVKESSDESKRFRETQGCLNAGAQLDSLLDTLVARGILRKQDIAEPEPADSPTLGWRVTPQLGKVFLVVKDLP